MLNTFLPTAPLLQKYIEVFYVFSHQKPNQFSYVAFPHINTGMSFLKGVTIQRGDYEVFINENVENKFTTCIEIVGKYTRPVVVNYSGNFEEIAIVFKPFGANHFLEEDMASVTPAHFQAYHNAKWNAFANSLFKLQNAVDRIKSLEAFLLENYSAKQENFMWEALQLLADNDSHITIEAIANKLNIHLKTFQRTFFKLMGCTAQEYRRIARFRHAVQSKTISTEVKSLTDVGYESNYYDQSYFIREFKKLTNLNPKKFFNAITLLDEEKIVWELK